MMLLKFLNIAVVLFFVQVESFTQWTTLNSGTSANLKSVYFINTSTGFVSGSGGIILKTTNGGANWNPLTIGLSADINSIYFYNSSTGLACANSGNIIISSNSGSSWNPVVSGTTDNLNAISFYDNIRGVCAGTNGTLMYTSNGGLNWTIAVNGFITAYYGIYMVTSFAAYAGGENTIFQPLLARTTNGGANWSYTAFYLNNNEGKLRDVYFISSTEGFAVSNVWNGQGGVSYTTNSGLNWSTQLFTNALNGVDFAGTETGYAVGINGYIIKTTNRGLSWLPQSSGISAILRSVDFVDSLTGFAVGDGGVIIKTTNGGVTAITTLGNEIPRSYGLHQNYPNPFNPNTAIKFDISKRGFTSLTIYDVLGRETAKLVNEELSPGNYEIKWNSSAYSSGIYFYRLISGDFSQTLKMILAK